MKKGYTVHDIQETAPGEFETRVTVTSGAGMHARPAALVARTAQTYEAELRLAVQGQQQDVDAKSILDILSLAAVNGSTLIVKGKGCDAKDALAAIAALVRSQFKEGLL